MISTMSTYSVRRAFSVFTLVALLWIPLSAMGAQDRPLNILFLFSDDQRADTIGALGNSFIQTPNIDRLAKRGFVFDNAYCMGSMSPAVCAPSRAMLLTGRTLWRMPIGFAVPWTRPENERGITPHTTFPQHFRGSGYATFGTGKWHQDVPPFIDGFTHGGNIFFGGMCKHEAVPVTPFEKAALGKNGATTGAKPSSELFADAAVEFLESRGSAGNPANKPFMMYVSFTAPHDPRTPPENFRKRYRAAPPPPPINFLPEHPFDNGELRVRDEKTAPFPRTRENVSEQLADYYGLIAHMDQQIGRILDALDRSGEADRTLIVFASDQGLAIGSHGLFGKQNLYEHSMKAPLIFAGPGVSKGRSDALVYLLDIFPTLCDLTGLSIPETVEGRSMASAIRGKSFKGRDSIYLAYRGIQRAVRDRRWKLIAYSVKGARTTQLFDLANDPDERRDLAGDPAHARTLARMTALLNRQLTALDDPDAEKFSQDVAGNRPAVR